MELSCPSLVRVGGLFTAKNREAILKLSSEAKVIKKITPSVPKGAATIATGGTNISKTVEAKPNESFTRNEIYIQLERVFLDQYSSSDAVVDVKLREVVSFCSDAIARQGVAAGLREVHVTPSVEDLIRRRVQEIMSSLGSDEPNEARNLDKATIRRKVYEDEGRFTVKLVSELLDRSKNSLAQQVLISSRKATEAIIPFSWGVRVRETAASIIERRSRRAAINQLMKEVPQLSSKVVRDFLENVITESCKMHSKRP